MICPNCGTQCEDNTKFCLNCGADVSVAQPAQPVQPAYDPAWEVPAEQPQGSNGASIVSLILGIVGLVTSLCYGIGIIPSIVAIILAFVSKKGGSMNGKAKAGAILGFINIGLWAIGVVIGVLFVILMAVAGGM